METNQIAKALTAPLTEGQDAKAAAFNHAVARLQNVIQTLQTEQRRTASLHGPDSTRAQRVLDLAAAHGESLAALQSAAKRAQARVPQPNPKEFILYGNVTNKAGAAASGIEVSAVDDKGDVLKTAATDSAGAFALHLAKPGTRSTTGITSEGKEAKAKAAAQQTPPTTIQLVASDKKKTYQVRGTATYQFEPGKLASEDLVVPA